MPRVLLRWFHIGINYVVTFVVISIVLTIE